MKRARIYRVAVACLLLWAGPAQAAEDPGYSANGIDIRSSAQGVTVQAQDRSLREIVQAVAQVSGIQFRFASEMLGEPVTVDLEAPDWQAALDRLLAGYSRIDFHDDAGRLTQVMLLGGGAGGVSAPSVSASVEREVPAAPPAPQAPDTEFPSGTGPISSALNSRISQVADGRELSRELYDSPELKALFARHGIESPSEWMLIKRRNTIRAVRRQDGVIEKKSVHY